MFSLHGAIFQQFGIHRPPAGRTQALHDSLQLTESSMPEPIISVKRLSKHYFISHKLERQGGQPYTALRDVIAREVSNIARKARQMLQGQQVLEGVRVQEFWALR